MNLQTKNAFLDSSHRMYLHVLEDEIKDYVGRLIIEI